MSTPFFIFFTLILFYYDRCGIAKDVCCCLLPYCIGYARHISHVDSAREGDLRVPKPERPPSRSHPVGHGRSVTSSMCNTADFSLYAAIFSVERCADSVVMFYYTHILTIKTELTVSRGAGVCPGTSAGEATILRLWEAALF